MLRQIAAVTCIGLASLRSRLATASVVVVGMASVVGVLTSMLSLTVGITRVYLEPEDDAGAVVWAGSANYDQSASLRREFISTILMLPESQKDPMAPYSQTRSLSCQFRISKALPLGRFRCEA